MSCSRNKLLIHKKADALRSEYMLWHVFRINLLKVLIHRSRTISKPQFFKIKVDRLRKCLGKSS